MKNQSREFYIYSDGIRLHAKLDFPDTEAEKVPLAIVFHGFTGHMEEPHITAVASCFRELGMASLRVELYGHGGSDGAFRDHTLFKWLTNAMDVVDTVKTWDFVSGCYLCGHSQGGLLAILLAGMERDFFRAVIPLSPATMIPEEARRGTLLGRRFDPDHIPDVLPLDEGEELGGNYIRAAQTIDVERVMRRYEGPALLVHGDADESVPLSCSEEAAKIWPRAELAVIPGDNHCYDFHLDEVLDAIRTYMKKQEDEA